MKKSILTNSFLAIFLAVSFASCSSDDNSTPPKKEEDEDTPNTEAIYYKHKALIEDYTSIGCPACPIGGFTIEEIMASELADRYVAVAIHDNYGSTQDPMRISWASDYARFMNLQYLPTLYFNRVKERYESSDILYGDKNPETGEDFYYMNIDEFKKDAERLNFLKKHSTIGIKINSELNETKGKVTFSLNFSEDINEKLQYIVYIIEDGLNFRQANSTPLYGNKTGKGVWTDPFTHNAVVLSSTNYKGESLGDLKTLKEEEIVLTADLEYKAKNVENLKVVVTILDEKGLSLNTQIAQGNTTLNYETIKK